MTVEAEVLEGEGGKRRRKEEGRVKLSNQTKSPINDRYRKKDNREDNEAEARSGSRQPFDAFDTKWRRCYSLPPSSEVRRDSTSLVSTLIRLPRAKRKFPRYFRGRLITAAAWLRGGTEGGRGVRWILRHRRVTAPGARQRNAMGRRRGTTSCCGWLSHSSPILHTPV